MLFGGGGTLYVVTAVEELEPDNDWLFWAFGEPIFNTFGLGTTENDLLLCNGAMWV